MLSTDNLGNLYVTDTDTTDSGEIFYYFTVVQGTDGFWTCYFACYNDLMPYYVSAFPSGPAASPCHNLPGVEPFQRLCAFLPRPSHKKKKIEIGA